MCVPKRIRTNRELLRLTKYANVRELLRVCGIRQRRIISDEKTSDLAVAAARQALERAGLPPADVEYIVVMTTLPEDLALATSNLVQKKLGAVRAAAFDLRAACAGPTYGLEVGVALIDCWGYNNVLLVGVEAPSLLIDAADPDTSILFGDGAGALLLARSSSRKVWVFANRSQGELSHLISRPFMAERLVFQGDRVFYHAVRAMVDRMNEALAKARLSLKEVNLVVPHQANLRIIKAVARRLSLTDKVGRLSRKVFVNIQRYGNTSAASIPIALFEAAEKGRLKKGALVALTAFGAGLSSGAAIFEW